MLPEPEVLSEPLPEPETEPLEDEPEPPVIDPEDEPEPVAVELDDEPEGVRERVVPESDAPLPEALLEPESTLPVAAPPREPLSLECEHPNASAPARIGIASNCIFIRHLLTLYFRGREEPVNPRKDPQDVEESPARRNAAHSTMTDSNRSWHDESRKIRREKAPQAAGFQH